MIGHRITLLSVTVLQVSPSYVIVLCVTLLRITVLQHLATIVAVAAAAKAVAAVGLQDGIVLGGSVGRGGGARAKGEGVVKLEPSDFQRMLSSSARDEEKQEKQDRYFFTNKNGRFVSAVPKVMLPKNQK